MLCSFLFFERICEKIVLIYLKLFGRIHQYSHNLDLGFYFRNVFNLLIEYLYMLYAYSDV